VNCEASWFLERANVGQICDNFVLMPGNQSQIEFQFVAHMNVKLFDNVIIFRFIPLLCLFIFQYNRNFQFSSLALAKLHTTLAEKCAGDDSNSSYLLGEELLDASLTGACARPSACSFSQNSFIGSSNIYLPLITPTTDPNNTLVSLEALDRRKDGFRTMSSMKLGVWIAMDSRALDCRCLHEVCGI